MRHRLLAVLGALALLLAALPPSLGAQAGPPLYPDLRNAKPTSLYFSRATINGSSHYVLRFSNNVWNAGEGRMEIQGDPNPDGSNTIYQNLYDAPSGGTQVAHQQVNSDLIYHPTHYHYHFAGLATYQLLQRDAAGVYKPTTKKSSKTSYCIRDGVRMLADAGPSQYTSCDKELQGLTVGWGDEYQASLPDQWVDLGTSPLPSGSYAVQLPPARLPAPTATAPSAAPLPAPTAPRSPSCPKVPPSPSQATPSTTSSPSSATMSPATSSPTTSPSTANEAHPRQPKQPAEHLPRRPLPADAEAG